MYCECLHDTKTQFRVRERERYRERETCLPTPKNDFYVATIIIPVNFQLQWVFFSDTEVK